MKRPREFGPFVSLLFLPLLLIAGAVTLLVAPFILLVQWRSEKSFASKMRAAGRAISWLELQTVIEREQGTMAAECLSEKGPSRLWWTPDDVRTECPHKCYPQRRSAELYYGPSTDRSFIGATATSRAHNQEPEDSSTSRKRRVFASKTCCINFWRERQARVSSLRIHPNDSESGGTGRKYTLTLTDDTTITSPGCSRHQQYYSPHRSSSPASRARQGHHRKTLYSGRVENLHG